MGFNKIHYVLDIFNQRPDIEWLLFSECDATITNLTIRIEDRIDNDYHFIIPVDQNNINAGNFLARNTPEGRAYLKMIIDLEPEYLNENWAEQQVIIDTIQDHTDIVKIVPQKYMNCYEQHLYDWTDCSKDIFGNDAIWAQGDWIVHWAALEKDRRIARAKEVLPLIVR
jgi:hypothetical protein